MRRWIQDYFWGRFDLIKSPYVHLPYVFRKTGSGHYSHPKANTTSQRPVTGPMWKHPFHDIFTNQLFDVLCKHQTGGGPVWRRYRVSYVTKVGRGVGEVQLILAYSWARPAILGASKGRGGVFTFLLFLNYHSCSSFFPVPLFHLPYYLFYLCSPFHWETT